MCHNTNAIILLTLTKPLETSKCKVHAVYLVADGHVCLANIVCVPEVSAFPPVHQCQSMETFHSIGGKSAMV